MVRRGDDAADRGERGGSGRAGLCGYSLDRWLAVQLEFLLDDEHTALVSAALESEDLPAEVREHIGARHRELYSSLTPLLAGPASSDPTVLRVRTMLIAGQVRTAADLERDGVDRAQVRAELSRCARAVPSAGS